MSYWRQPIGVLGWSGVATLALLLGACGADVVEPPADVAESGPRATPAETSVQTRDHYTTLLEFQGTYLAETGQLTLVAVPPLDVPLQDGEFRTLGQSALVSQPGWCVQRVVQDGEIGTNPNESVEVYTEPGETGAATPFQPLPTTCPGLLPDPFYEFGGVFCTNVVIRNFYGTGLQDVHAEI